MILSYLAVSLSPATFQDIIRTCVEVGSGTVKEF